MSSSRRSVARGVLVLAIALSAVAACQKTEVAPPITDSVGLQQPTPAPPWGAAFAALPTDSAKRAFLRANLLAYATSLPYDSADGAADEQRVLVGNFPGGHFGPRLRIEPAFGKEHLNDNDYDAGRVVARIRSISRDSAYPKIGLANVARDTVLYWFVYRHAGQWRSAIIRPDSTGIVLPTDSMMHAQGKWRQSLARWIWREQDDDLWVNCTSMRCCRVAGDESAAAL